MKEFEIEGDNIFENFLFAQITVKCDASLIVDCIFNDKKSTGMYR
jgi:hypothetical protein